MYSCTVDHQTVEVARSHGEHTGTVTVPVTPAPPVTLLNTPEDGVTQQKRGQRSRYNRVENSSVTMKSPTASSDSRWLLVVFITLLRPESSSAALLDKPPQIVKDLNQKMTLKLGPLNRSVAITTSQCKHLELTTEISVMQEGRREEEQVGMTARLGGAC